MAETLLKLSGMSTGVSFEVNSDDGIIQNTAKSDMIFFVGPGDAMLSVGTWTLTRVAAGDWCQRKSAADQTAYVAFDLSDLIRTTASKGLKINSIDYVYQITAGALDAHSCVLKSSTHANNVANAIADHGGTLTGTCATATQTNPYVTNISCGTAAFNNTAKSKIIFEATVDAGAASVYSVYGLFVNCSMNLN